VDLRTECFAHGQLYTALSRVRRRSDSIVLFTPSNTQLSTSNIVYSSLLL
ncbi:hypothetical protein BU15DRAFT_57771, partial [Melanogaster broomeanus]